MRLVGIIVSTAYIHLLLEAFLSFNSPCLGHLSYPATAPAICMAATMLVFTIDFSAARYLQSRARRTPNNGETSSPVEPEKGANALEGHTHEFDLDDQFMTTNEYNRRALWDLELLEGGIVFHSVFIGVTLGVRPTAGPKGH